MDCTKSHFEQFFLFVINLFALTVTEVPDFRQKIIAFTTIFILGRSYFIKENIFKERVKNLERELNIGHLMSQIVNMGLFLVLLSELL